MTSVGKPRVGWYGCSRRLLGAGLLVTWSAGGLLVQLGWARVRGRSGAHAMGRSLARLFQALGGAFVKVGQVLSSRADLLPGAVIEALEGLQDRMAPFDSRLIPGLLQEAFGRPVEEIFEWVDPAPVASASIATVHRARLVGGQTVALKLRRPGIVRKVLTDLTLLRMFGRLLSHVPGMKLIPVEDLVEEFCRAVAGQIDFNLEASNHRGIQRNLRTRPEIKIPVLIDDLCCESVLTMEYIEDLPKVQDLSLTSDERKSVALVSLQAVYQMIFVDGLVHADLHPGNIFFRRGPECVLLDMGLVARLDAGVRDAFTRFFMAMASNEGIECARIVYETAADRHPACDRAKFEQAMVSLVDEYSSKNAVEFEVVNFVIALFNVQRHFRLRGSADFTMTIMSLVVFEGIIKALCPTLDFQEEARRFFVSSLPDM
jgi:ubiquinone biosynthesis protein